MSLLKAVIKKLGIILLTLLLVSFAVYAAFELIPGDPALSKLGTDATPEALAALRHEMGLDKPFIFRYFSWLLSCFKGDFGISLSYNRTVIAMIGDKLPITVTLTVLSMLITILISVPTAVLMAKYAKRTLDRTFYVADQVFMAVPSFFLGILLTYVFGMVLHWFKPGGYISYSKDFWGFIAYLIMPSVAIAVPKCAMSVKLLRASILEEADKEYVRTAYSTRQFYNAGHVQTCAEECDHTACNLLGYVCGRYDSRLHSYRAGVQYPGAWTHTLKLHSRTGIIPWLRL